MTITPADTVIIVGVVMGALGLAAPPKVLAWQALNATTLVIVGVIVGLIGLAVKVVLE
jgi:hypothetical protein